MAVPAFNYFTIIGIVLQYGEQLLADAAEIQADQPVSLTLVPTIAGHKYNLVLSLTPVPGQARGAASSINWFTIIGLILAEGGALLADAEEIVAGQAFTTPSVDVTLSGYKFAAAISGTPVAA